MTAKKQIQLPGLAPTEDQSNNIDDALRHFREASELVSNDPASRLTLGLSLAQAHHYEQAIKVLEALVEAMPAKRDLHTWLGALYREVGQEEKSAETIRDFFATHPHQRLKSARKNAPSVLCTFGVENTEYRVGRSANGQAAKKRRGGHFNLQYLLNEKDYSFNNYSVVRDNINQLKMKGSYDLLLNTIADPDVELKSLESLVEFVEANPDLPLINHPAQVIKTARDENYKRFKDVEGIYFPRTERIFSDGRTSAEIADDIQSRGFVFPLIMRVPGTHTARSTECVETRDALLNYLEASKADCHYVIEFVANASDEGHYSKIRFFAIDGTLYPVVYHVDQVWNVHGGNRKTFMSEHNWMQDRERAFLEDPSSVIGQDVYDRLKKLPEIVGLDFFGFDCTVLPDGQVLIFELNPAMRHSFDHAKRFEYMRPHMQAITDAFTQMVETRAAKN